MNVTFVRSVLALLAAVLLHACTGDEAARLDENKAVVRRSLDEVFNTGDVARIPEFFAPEYSEVHDGVVHDLGHEGARAHVHGVRAAFPDLRVTVEQQIAEGDWVVSVITARGTHRGPWLGAAPTGRVLEFTGVNLDRVVDGRIVQHGGAANLFGPLLEAGAIQVVGEGGE